MDVREVLLPGVGLRFEFENHDGDRIGVIALRTGDFEVVVYPHEDPDQAQRVFRLTDEEADALAQILGAPRIAEKFAELTSEVPGLDAARSRSVPAARSSTVRSGTPRPAPEPGRPSSRSSATTRSWPRRARRNCCAPVTCWW